jgi:polyphosphate kinase 2 (PPK2 family)
MKLPRILRACRIDKPGRCRLADHDPSETFGLSRLGELQQPLYANGQWGVLLVFQGMDAAGKDGVVKHVMSGINPQGCEVHSFKEPSAEELEHDFLWRAAKPFRSAGASAFSTVPTTKKCSWCACTRNC